MKKMLFVGALVGLLFLIGCAEEQPQPPRGEQPLPQPQPQPPQQPQPVGQDTNIDLEIMLRDNEFVSSTREGNINTSTGPIFRVNHGDRVRFVVEEGTHTVTIDDLNVNQELNAGQALIVTMSRDGTFVLRCRFHENQGMIAQLVIGTGVKQPTLVEQGYPERPDISVITEPAVPRSSGSTSATDRTGY